MRSTLPPPVARAAFSRWPRRRGLGSAAPASGTRLSSRTWEVLALGVQHQGTLVRHRMFEGFLETVTSLAVVDAVVSHWPLVATAETVVGVTRSGANLPADFFAMVLLKAPYHVFDAPLSSALSEEVNAAVREVFFRLGKRVRWVGSPALPPFGERWSSRERWVSAWESVLAHTPALLPWLNQRHLHRAAPVSGLMHARPRL